MNPLAIRIPVPHDLVVPLLIGVGVLAVIGLIVVWRIEGWDGTKITGKPRDAAEDAVAKARRHCVQTLQSLVFRPAVLGPWPPEFWRDAFVIGFFVFAVNVLSKIATGDQLTSYERVQVLTGTLEDLGGYSRDVVDRVDALTRARDPDFFLGSRNAETIITYAYNLHPMPGDPDVAAATKLAQGSALSDGVGRAEITGALMHLLFTDVVKRRLGGGAGTR